MRLGMSGLLAMQSILPVDEGASASASAANASGRLLLQDEADQVGDGGGYNLSLQIAGIFILILTSFLGMSLAFLMEHLKERRGGKSAAASWQARALHVTVVALRGIGVGVIISTALIHLIGEAYVSRVNSPHSTLHSLPLPPHTSLSLSSSPSALRLTVCLLSRGGLVRPSFLGPAGGRARENQEYFKETAFGEVYEQWPMVFAMAGMFVMSLLEFLHHRVDAKACPVLDLAAPSVTPSFRTAAAAADSAKASVTNPLTSQEGEEGKGDGREGGTARQQRNAVLVEGSILIHSVLIGFDLGLQPERQWAPLVCAIAFHQFFEGFAIGQVVLEARFGLLKKSLMILFYSLTTSVGVCIGIGVTLGNSYDGGSQAANVTIAVINSICGGFLLFMGMSIFWVDWFVNNAAMHREESALAPSAGFLGVLFGMVAMAVIGMWA